MKSENVLSGTYDRKNFTAGGSLANILAKASLSFTFPETSPLVSSDGLYTLTYTRSGTAGYYDDEGIYNYANANELPRYYNPVSKIFVGIALERQVTNLALHSEDFSNAAWTATNCTVTPAIGPFITGATTLNRLVASGSGSFITQTIPTSSATTYLFYTFAKRETAGDYLGLLIQPTISDKAGARFDLTNQTSSASAEGASSILSSGVQVAGAGLYLCWMRVNLPVAAGCTWSIGPSDSTQTDLAPFGSATLRTIYTAGVMVCTSPGVANSLPCTYVPTVENAVSRGGYINRLLSGAWRNSTEGAYYLEATPLSMQSVGSIFRVSDGSAANSLEVYVSGNAVRVLCVIASATIFDQTVGNITAGKQFKLAITYNSAGVYTMGLDGSTFTLGTAGTYTATRAAIGGNYSATAPFEGYLARFMYFSKALDTLQLVTLTS